MNQSNPNNNGEEDVRDFFTKNIRAPQFNINDVDIDVTTTGSGNGNDSDADIGDKTTRVDFENFVQVVRKLMTNEYATTLDVGGIFAGRNNSTIHNLKETIKHVLLLVELANKSSLLGKYSVIFRAKMLADALPSNLATYPLTSAFLELSLVAASAAPRELVELIDNYMNHKTNEWIRKKFQPVHTYYNDMAEKLRVQYLQRIKDMLSATDDPVLRSKIEKIEKVVVVDNGLNIIKSACDSKKDKLAEYKKLANDMPDIKLIYSDESNVNRSVLMGRITKLEEELKLLCE